MIIDVKDLKVRGLDFFNLASFYKPKYELPIKLIRKEKIEVKRGDKEIAYLVPDLYEESVTVYDKNLLIEANIKFIEEKLDLEIYKTTTKGYEEAGLFYYYFFDIFIQIVANFIAPYKSNHCQ